VRFLERTSRAARIQAAAAVGPVSGWPVRSHLSGFASRVRLGIPACRGRPFSRGRLLYCRPARPRLAGVANLHGRQAPRVPRDRQALRMPARCVFSIFLGRAHVGERTRNVTVPWNFPADLAFLIVSFFPKLFPAVRRLGVQRLRWQLQQFHSDAIRIIDVRADPRTC
jgi:hypothetical protein